MSDYRTVEGDEVVLNGYYQTRRGDIVQIPGIEDDDAQFPIRSFCESYNTNGYVYGRGYEDGGDLMRRVSVVPYRVDEVQQNDMQATALVMDLSSLRLQIAAMFVAQGIAYMHADALEMAQCLIDRNEKFGK